MHRNTRIQFEDCPLLKSPQVEGRNATALPWSELRLLLRVRAGCREEGRGAGKDEFPLFGEVHVSEAGLVRSNGPLLDVMHEAAIKTRPGGRTPAAWLAVAGFVCLCCLLAQARCSVLGGRLRDVDANSILQAALSKSRPEAGAIESTLQRSVGNSPSGAILVAGAEPGTWETGGQATGHSTLAGGRQCCDWKQKTAQGRGD